ncbi:MAG: thiamine biosynthesis protein [Desulfobulbaceae bacterium]|nr:MAG: thiamine biosynthesis protein [Desulfobulbaceae bacterium]
MTTNKFSFNGGTMKRIQIITISLCLVLSIPCRGFCADLKLGVLLIEDAVPIWLAEQQDLFAANNVDVELVPFLSALERDSAMTAGAIDGALTDPVGAILLDKGQGLYKITSLCLGKTPAEGPFSILAAPDSKLESVEDLKHVEIGVSNATIIEYVTDRLLEDQGFSQEEIKKIEVKKMPIRMQMLLSGAIEAATLPEPLATIAAGKGARVLISDADSSESLSQTVLLFSTSALTEKPTAVRSFFQAYQAAVLEINKQPESYRSLFVEKGRIPPFLAESYPIPQYPLPAPLSEGLYESVITWLTKRNLSPSLEYKDMVAQDFL